MEKFTIWRLTVTPSGRISPTWMAEFAEVDDAIGYAKTQAFKLHENILLIGKYGNVYVYSEHP